MSRSSEAPLRPDSPLPVGPLNLMTFATGGTPRAGSRHLLLNIILSPLDTSTNIIRVIEIINTRGFWVPLPLYLLSLFVSEESIIWLLHLWLNASFKIIFSLNHVQLFPSVSSGQQDRKLSMLKEFPTLSWLESLSVIASSIPLWKVAQNLTCEASALREPRISRHPSWV